MRARCHLVSAIALLALSCGTPARSRPPVVADDTTTTTSAAADAAVPDPTAALNLDFEDVTDGQPTGWVVDAAQGSAGSNEIAKSGERSVRLESPEGARIAVARHIPAETYRGATLIVRAHLRAEAVESSVGLWAHVVASDGRVLALEMPREASLAGTAHWTPVELELAIPDDAGMLSFGVVLQGKGTAWADAMELGVRRQPVVEITGTLRDAAGKPIPGGFVALVSADADEPASVASADDAGRYLLQAPAGSYAITVNAAERGGLYIDVREFSKNETLDLRAIPVERRVRGRVTDDQGRPVAGMRVDAFRKSDVEGDIFSAFTDGDGRFEFAVPDAPGMWILVQDGRAYRTQSYEVEPSAEIPNVDISVILRSQPDDEVLSSLRAHTAPLAGVDPNTEDTSDLAALDELATNSNVIALGEATHGSREFFTLKHRVFRYLVEKHGFHGIAVEANRPEARAVNDYVLHGVGDPRKALLGLRLWPIATESMLELVEWMRRYNDGRPEAEKIQFYGIDMQYTDTAATNVLLYLDRVDPAFAATVKEGFGALLRPRAVSEYDDLSAETKAAIDAALAGTKERLTKRKRRYVKKSDASAWLLASQDLEVLTQAVAKAANDDDFGVRDRAMADNVLALLAADPKRKIAVWAHNHHIQRVPISGAYSSMGTKLAEELDASYAAIGLFFNQGRFIAAEATGPYRGAVHEFKVGPAPAGTVEAAIATFGFPAALLQLRGFPAASAAARWLSVLRPTRVIGSQYAGEEKMLTEFEMLRAFDALVYVNETTAAQRL